MPEVPQGGISEHTAPKENEHRASLEKGNVDAESVETRRRPQSGGEASNKSTGQSHRGIGEGMRAKDRRSQHGKPEAVGSKSPTGNPRGSEQAGSGDGEVRSSKESINHRGAKGP